MRKSIFVSIAFICVFALVILMAALLMNFSKGILEGKEVYAGKKAKTPGRVGEKITYEVKLGVMKLGEAKYVSLEPFALDGISCDVISFQTKLANFTDSETIYSAPDTFLPVMVKRDISTWLSSERIVEDYDQKKFTLRIKKHKGKKTYDTLIEKSSPLHHAILLPFYVRTIPELDIGWLSKINLPKADFEIKLSSIEDVSVPAGIFEAYHFESTPKKFEIWISTDPRRIPIKIKGMGNLGYVLQMKEYSP